MNNPIVVTPELIASVAGILLSLLASYIPGFSVWFAGLDSIPKRLINLAALLAVCLAIVALSCGGVVPWITCTRVDITLVVQIFIAALIANQATFLASPATSAVKAKKTELKS